MLARDASEEFEALSVEQEGLPGDSYASGRFPIMSFAVSPLNQSEVLDDREGVLPTDDK